LVLLFTFSLLNFTWLVESSIPGGFAKTADEGEMILHPTGCIPAPVKSWPQVDVQKLKKDLTSKGITALPTSVDWSSKEPPVGDRGLRVVALPGQLVITTRHFKKVKNRVGV